MASDELQSCEIKELSIPVAYGFIAAKAWGSENGMPVLALHGWQDNAGTFDTLIPLLSSSFHVVAIDAIGHGLSSHKPKGSFYHFMEMLVDVKRVINYLKWNKFSIIGHSMGGVIALMYGSVFPEAVNNIVLLDIFQPSSVHLSALPQITQNGVEQCLHIEQKCNNPIPVYSYEDAKSRLIRAIMGDINSNSADILLKRGAKVSTCGKGVVFTRDIRVKVGQDLQKFSHNVVKAYMRNLKCNLLIILGKNSFVSKRISPAIFQEFSQIYEKACKSFKIVEVEGGHFVHLNYPKRVSPYINDFLGSEFIISSKL